MTAAFIASVLLLLGAAYVYYYRELSERAQMRRDLEDAERRIREGMQ